MDRNTGLVIAFMEEARAVSLGERRDLGVSPRDLLTISSNAAMKVEFRRALERENDPELRDPIRQFVLDFADSLDDDAQSAERKVELVDRAGTGVAASVTAAGIGTTAASFFGGATAGTLLGPIGTLLGGLVRLVVAAAGRHALKCVPMRAGLRHANCADW